MGRSIGIHRSFSEVHYSGLGLRILRWLTVAAISMLLATSAGATTSTKPTKSSSNSHKSAKSGKSSSSKSSKKKSAKSSTAHGQRGIDPTRTREIQEALIREHYLAGEPTGAWDQSTKDALARFQEANGWQTKSVPDSRALIKLGLGPDKKGLLNPDTAFVTSPHELGTPHDAQPGGSAQQ
jgi:Putative peptidoglycan binding domain